MTCKKCGGAKDGEPREVYELYGACGCLLEPRTPAQVKAERGVGAFPPPMMKAPDVAAWVHAHPDYQALLRNLTSVQARCTELIQEVRALRRAAIFVEEGEAPFVSDYKPPPYGTPGVGAPTLDEVMTTAHPGEHLAASMQGKPPVGSVAWLAARDGK